MHEKSFGFKEINSQVDDPEFYCVCQTQIPTFPKLYQVHQFQICGIANQ